MSDRTKDQQFSTHEQIRPVCPHCGYMIDELDMPDIADFDIYALAPEEDTNVIECPQCDKEYWVRGGYNPHYTTAFAEEQL